MRFALGRVNPVIVGVVVMFAVALAYIEFAPDYQPVPTDSGSLGG